MRTYRGEGNSDLAGIFVDSWNRRVRSFRMTGIIVAVLMYAVLNLFLGILLIVSPANVTLDSFAFIFGFLLMIFGIDLLAVSGKLAYFNVTNYGWVIATGIISILASAFFLILPLASTIALNYILAIYLMVGGIALLIESFSMKDLKIGG